MDRGILKKGKELLVELFYQQQTDEKKFTFPRMLKTFLVDEQHKKEGR